MLETKYRVNLRLITEGIVIDLTPSVTFFRYESHLFRPSDDKVLFDIWKFGLYHFNLVFQNISGDNRRIINDKLLSVRDPATFYRSKSYLDLSIEELDDKDNPMREIFKMKLIPYKVHQDEQQRQLHSDYIYLTCLPITLFDVMYNSFIYFKGIGITSNDKLTTTKLLDICFHTSNNTYVALDVPTFQLFSKKQKKLNNPQKLKCEPLKIQNDLVLIPANDKRLQPLITFDTTTKENEEEKVDKQAELEDKLRKEKEYLEKQLEEIDDRLKYILPLVTKANELNPKLDELRNMVTDLTKSLNDVISRVNKIISDTISNVISQIGNNLPLTQQANDFFSFIQNTTSNLFNSIGYVGSFVGNVLNDISLLNNFVNELLSLPSYINNLLQIPNMIASYLTNLPYYMVTPFANVFNSLDFLVDRINPATYIDSCHKSGTSIFGNIDIPTRYSNNSDLIKLFATDTYGDIFGDSISAVNSQLNDLRLSVYEPYNLLNNYTNNLVSFPDNIRNLITSSFNNIFPPLRGILNPVDNLLTATQNLVRNTASLPTKLFLIRSFLGTDVLKDLQRKNEIESLLKETNEKLEEIEKQKIKKKSNVDTVKINSDYNKIVFTFDKEEVENSYKLNDSIPKPKDKKIKSFPSKYVLSYPAFLHYSNSLVPVPLLSFKSIVHVPELKTVVVRFRVYKPGRQPDWKLILPWLDTSSDKKDLDTTKVQAPLGENTLVLNTPPFIGYGEYDENGINSFAIIQEKNSLKSFIANTENVEIPVVSGKVVNKKIKGKLKPKINSVYKIPSKVIYSSIPFLDENTVKQLEKMKLNKETIRLYSGETSGIYNNLPGNTIRDFITDLFLGQVIKIAHFNLDILQKINLGDVVELSFSRTRKFTSYEGLYLVTGIEVGISFSKARARILKGNKFDFPSVFIELSRPVSERMIKEYVDNNSSQELWNIGKFLSSEK